MTKSGLWQICTWATKNAHCVQIPYGGFSQIRSQFMLQCGKINLHKHSQQMSPSEVNEGGSTHTTLCQVDANLVRIEQRRRIAWDLTCTCDQAHMHACTHAHAHSSYMTWIGVHEMHGRLRPNSCHITDLLVVDLCLSLAYFMMTYPLPLAGKLPIEKLVATNKHSCVYTRRHTHVHTHFSMYISFQHMRNIPSVSAASTNTIGIELWQR